MKSRAGSSTKKRKQNRSKRGTGKSNQNRSVSEWLSIAESCLTSFDAEGAIKSFSQAAILLRAGKGGASIATREKDLIQVLAKLGECKVSVGDQDGAKSDFQEALSLLENTTVPVNGTTSIEYHETRFSLHLYIGQLCMEYEALEIYMKGVESLESCLSIAQDSTTDDENMEDNTVTDPKLIPDLRRKLSGAYCTIAELFLTDLCYDENAETQCETNLEKALHIKDEDGEPMVDALQTMASLRLSQQNRRTEAIPYILNAFEKMKVGSEALATLVGLGEQPEDGDMMADQQKGAMELKEVDAASNLPEYEFRCQTAKLLLECAALLKESKCHEGSVASKTDEERCIAAAISILGSLLAQNDEVVEIWYLAGCAFSIKSPPLVDSATFYLQKAMEMLKDVKKGLEQELQFAGQDESLELQEQLEENRIQIDDVQAKLDEMALAEGSLIED